MAAPGEEQDEVVEQEDLASTDDSAWTLEKGHLFVELWQSRPCLYDITIGDYSNRIKKSKAWLEIATELEMPGERDFGLTLALKIYIFRTYYY